MSRKGVFPATKKNGELYYRSSITFKNKHISLGSFPTEAQAHQAYKEADKVLHHNTTIEDYSEENNTLSFDKWVTLINYRETGMYIKTPILIQKNYFNYYYSPTIVYKFDADDLFYYSTHKIMKRGGHLFVSDFGMQVNILSRYGIKNYGVAGKDYHFVNGDTTDFRYGNIEIVHRYHGVVSCQKRGKIQYISKIHLNGNWIIGKYATENEAAIAYNKAAEYLTANGITKAFPENYILEMTEEEYQRIYDSIEIRKDMLDKILEKKELFNL